VSNDVSSVEHRTLIEPKSDNTVSIRKWRLALAMVVMVMLGGTAVGGLVALGVADPPRAGTLMWQSSSFDEWCYAPPHSEGSPFDEYIPPIAIPKPPFTIEVIALNNAHPKSAWGIRLNVYGGFWYILVSGDRYFAQVGLEWQEFPPIRRNAENKIYVHVDADNRLTVRINDEIVVENITIDNFHPASISWGVVMYDRPVLALTNASLYSNDNLLVMDFAHHSSNLC
jgi:hypothetical protein